MFEGRGEGDLGAEMTRIAKRLSRAATLLVGQKGNVYTISHRNLIGRPQISDQYPDCGVALELRATSERLHWRLVKDRSERFDLWHICQQKYSKAHRVFDEAGDLYDGFFDKQGVCAGEAVAGLSSPQKQGPCDDVLQVGLKEAVAPQLTKANLLLDDFFAFYTQSFGLFKAAMLA